MSCQIPVGGVATRQNMDDSPHLVLQRWVAIPRSFFIVIKCVVKVVAGMEMGQIPVGGVATRQKADDSPHLVLQRLVAIASTNYCHEICI